MTVKKKAPAVHSLEIEIGLPELIPYRFCLPPLISQGFALPASPRGSQNIPFSKVGESSKPDCKIRFWHTKHRKKEFPCVLSLATSGTV